MASYTHLDGFAILLKIFLAIAAAAQMSSASQKRGGSKKTPVPREQGDSQESGSDTLSVVADIHPP